MIEATVLGRRVDYPSAYSPGVLVGVPRELNRAGMGIGEGSPLPFVGFDMWNAYEVSCLTDKGMPVAAILRMVVPASSPRLVESKSLKLYLNSLNMERLGATSAEALDSLRCTVAKDVSGIVGAEVGVGVFSPDEATSATADDGFSLLEDNPAAREVVFSSYTETPDVLSGSGKGGRMRVKSHLLRSNCKITHQPDWGTVWVDMEGSELPEDTSLLQYIVSLRGENHFHEEICELVYVRLMQRFSPDKLAVVCSYTRRGGIDINPCRATHEELLPDWLSDVSMPVSKQGRQ